MPRIRTIKPSFWDDPTVAALRLEARLLCVGLISFADDEGRFLASIRAITGYVFPHDDEQDLPLSAVRSWRDEIDDSGIIELYWAEGCEYGWFPRWLDHQVINRPTPSKLPPPPGAPGLGRNANGAVRPPGKRGALRVVEPTVDPPDSRV